MENTAEFNEVLNVLKCIDPCTTDILARVEKASLYKFCAINNEWKDNGIEGELFVCSRSEEPYGCIHILNHALKQNMMEPILEDWDWKTQELLFLYKKGHTIFGIRFYNDEDFTKVTVLMESIMDSMKYKPVEIEKPKELLTAPKIVKMLCEAQEDFQKVASLIQGQLLQSQQQPSFTNGHVSPQNSFIPIHKSEAALNTAARNSDIDPMCPNGYQANASSMIGMEGLENLASMLSVLEHNTGKPMQKPPDMMETREEQDQMQNDHFDNLEKPDPLSRKQMIFALIYLLKNDNDFVMQVYKAYLKSFMEML